MKKENTRLPQKSKKTSEVDQEAEVKTDNLAEPQEQPIHAMDFESLAKAFPRIS